MTESDNKQTCEELKELFKKYKGVESDLIPLLQAAQGIYGYISDDSMLEIAKFLQLPKSMVYGVTTFYSQFHLIPQGKNKIKICEGTACHVRGSKELIDVVDRKIGIKHGETTADGNFSLERVACIGSCALAPAIINNDKILGPMTADKLGNLIDTMSKGCGNCTCDD